MLLYVKWHSRDIAYIDILKIYF